MKNPNGKQQRSIRKRKKRKAAKLCCIIPIIGIMAIFVAAFGNMILVDYKADNSQNISDIPSENKVPISQPKQNNTNISVADKSEWNLILVNQWNKLPDDFSVNLTKLKNGHSIDERAYPHLQTMMDDAHSVGLSPIICSSYRTQEKQQYLFDNQTNTYVACGYSQENAKTETAKWVAIPGTSEHQSGLAVDIVALSYQTLDEKQENTAEQKWLMQNAYKYGFILRYPSDKSEITGINYEPWHYRYVGKEAAKEIYARDLCLEEYLDSLKIGGLHS